MKNDIVNIGVDIGGSHIGIGIVSGSGRILFKTSFNYQKTANADSIVSEIVRYIIMLNNKSIEYNKAPAAHIGLGIPGIINAHKGLIDFSPNIPQFKNFRIVSAVEKKLAREKIKIPVFIENDGNCAAFAEAQFGWGRHLKKNNLIHLTLGTGVGGGIILKGKIYSGYSNNSGELGHMTINFDGRMCSCGNTGCLEAYCNTAGFLNTVQDFIKETGKRSFLKYCRNNTNFLTPEIMNRAARNGDKAACEIFERYGRHLGTGIANLINIFNIELITIGGGIAQAGNFFIKQVISEAHKRAFKIPAENCQIKISKLGVDAGFIGASFLYAQFSERLKNE